MIPRRVARVAGNNLVHRHSISNGVARRGQQVNYSDQSDLALEHVPDVCEILSLSSPSPSGSSPNALDIHGALLPRQPGNGTWDGSVLPRHGRQARSSWATIRSVVPLSRIPEMIGVATDGTVTFRSPIDYPFRSGPRGVTANLLGGVGQLDKIGQPVRLKSYLIEST